MALSFSLPNYTSILVKGVDSEKLLQGQISCDLAQNKRYFDGLFCDEKGYIITNAVVIKDDFFTIIVKKSVSKLLKAELEKFAKFFNCEVSEENQIIYGECKNKVFKKHLGKKDFQETNIEWDLQTMKNFCFDIEEQHSNKFRINELGYNFEDYVSYDKGCYRGQEIIARLTYLGKKVKKAVVFNNAIESISDSSGKKIGKKILEIQSKKFNLTQFFVEENEYYHEGKKIIPVSSQWEQDQDL
ncbi:MAG: hypothetical protein ACJ0GO_01015 [Gammaproteobacteria bacterium]|tara:strand:- start:479 stop:1207 length:729 start_codon:yes stop_codon:yes gene_type:complete